MRRGVMLLFLPLLLSFGLFPQTSEAANWEKERMYFIMIDRFENGKTSNDIDVNKDDPKAYHGGDLAGVTKRLDYIKDEGFTSIWLTPVFKNRPNGYHGYWTEDYYKIDPHFGTKEEFKTLVDEAHERDIKVVLDLVVNHLGPNHPLVEEKPDWFHEEQPIMNWNNQVEVENNWLFDLPDFNTENPEVVDYLVDVANYWVDETGIDGYRLDTVRHVPPAFWKEFIPAVKEKHPDLFLLGEVFDGDPRKIATYSELGFDSVTNFPFYYGIKDQFARKNGSAEELDSVYNRDITFNPKAMSLATFIDNHDLKRFITEAKIGGTSDEERQLRLALFALYAAPGMPVVYQGTEVAMPGGEDPGNRMMMEFDKNEKMQEYVKTLNQMRQDYPAFATGKQRLLGKTDHMAVYARESKNQTAIYAINLGEKKTTMRIKASEIGDDQRLRGLLFSDLVRQDGDAYEITLDGSSANGYILEDSQVNWWSLVAIGSIAPILALILLLVHRRRVNRSNEKQ
ncbi:MULTISPECIES: alpha-amylase family glycosyl hydrolase [unclassified Exiguobacterium]|uniref:alpha-amylase family glycosyl hydrolase n=1 Tax=unclassified Exiguobacterium TaxID=2644629 RepID=UPI000B591354|nr:MULTISPECIES: alpha-amylase family glycosyl hydrolase [unclassified Exiguobacterium]ASI34720.1 alpha-amylase [Exiguobacterium sp. N4-1P]